MRLAIATLLTLANAVCGFVGIALLLGLGESAVTPACLLVFGAWLFDMLDGVVARQLGVESPLGAVLDSLCDVVSFGALPPAILVVDRWDGPAWALPVAAGATYLTAAILRLGRYTAKAMAAPVGQTRLWFDGVSSPGAAMCFAAAVLASTPVWLQVILTVLLALLMVSALPYPDIAKFYLDRRLPLWTLLIPVAAVIADWRKGLGAVLAVYICIGPAVAAYRTFKGKRSSRSSRSMPLK